MDRKVETRPPKVIERVVQLLMPPASGEHVLGDLSERYVSPRQYLADALRTLPFVVLSRVRRTSNPPLDTAAVAMLWFWGVIWGSGDHLWLAAGIAAFVAISVLILRPAYRVYHLASLPPPLSDYGWAALGVLLSQEILWVAFPSLALSPDALLGGFPVGFIMTFFMRGKPADPNTAGMLGKH
jgi:hypothetical protein